MRGMCRFRTVKPLMALASALVWLTVGDAAMAQASRPPADDGRGAPLSLQSQLGSIPLVSPRGGARAVVERVVRITQLDGRDIVGEPRVLSCPLTGCHQVISLLVDNAVQNFQLELQFVGHGTYVALQSRSAAIAQVVEFRQGKAGPVFFRGTPDTSSQATLSFVAVPATSLRRLDAGVDGRPVDGRTVASGNVYNRKQAPDIVLRVLVERAKEK